MARIGRSAIFSGEDYCAAVSEGERSIFGMFSVPGEMPGVHGNAFSRSLAV
jgi:hypothetical protein